MVHQGSKPRQFAIFAIQQLCMKKFFTIGVLSVIAVAGRAQQTALGCVDAAMRVQAEQIKRDFKAQGFVSVKDMMITMKSKQASGVRVALTAGKLHQLVFIGSKDANNLHFEIYDKADFRVDERKLDDPMTTNLVIYSIVPEKTDTMVVALTQNLKEKTACGSFTVLRQDEVPDAKPTKAQKNGKK
jgi:hypothetical protein